MIESPSHMPNKRSALLDFSAYQRLDAKKALIGITQIKLQRFSSFDLDPSSTKTN